MTLGTFLIITSFLVSAVVIIKGLIDLRSLRPSIEVGHDEAAISQKRLGIIVVIAASIVSPVLLFLAVTYVEADVMDFQLF